MAYPSLGLEQLYIGSTILVYTRQLFIEDYADDFTRKHLRGLQETYAIHLLFQYVKAVEIMVVYAYVFDNLKKSCICFQLTCHDPLPQDIGNDKARCISIHGKNNRVHYIQWISY